MTNANAIRSPQVHRGVFSIRVRMMLLFLLSSLLLFAAFALIVRYFAAAHFEELDAEELAGKLALARGELEAVTSADQLAELARALETVLVGHPGMTLGVDQAGTTIVAASGPGQPPAHASAPRRARSLRFTHPVLGELRIDATLDIAHHEAFLDELVTVLLATAGVAVPVAALLGWVLAGSALRPVARLTQKARTVSAHNLEGRIVATPVPRELQELASAFDEMLARLHESFERLADYSVDLAHELRTPLNNVITQVEVALSRPRADDEYREVLYGALEQCRRLSRMVADMLFIARAEKGLLVPERAVVDLAAAARKVGEYFLPVAAENDVTVVERGAGTIVGDPLMIERAIANLLSNAIRHARRATPVEVEIETSADQATVRVVNRGETIPPERLARLFERFYRAETERPRAGEGTGLGLAITKSIVEAHGGSVTVGSTAGVTRFELRFPHARRAGRTRRADVANRSSA